MTYFENEIWDTGGDGRITILGDIYSTADPLGIFIGSVPFEVLTLDSTGSQINSDLNIVGSLTVNGVPLQQNDWNVIIKTSNQNIEDSTTTSLDLDLQFPVLAGKTYGVIFNIIYSGSDSTVDYRFRTAVDAGVITGRGWASGYNSAMTLGLQAMTGSGVSESSVIIAGTDGPITNPHSLEIQFSFLASANATFSYRFANGTSGVGRISRTWAGSTLRWKQLD